ILASDGIARWDGNRWKDVVARCVDPCSRDVDLIPYEGTGVVAAASTRKPAKCYALRAYKGRLYCIDTGKNSLSSWDGSLWRQTGFLSINTPPQGNNNYIVLNGTD